MLIYTKEAKVSKEQTLGLSVNEFVRWGCLLESIELIENKAQSLKIDLNKNLDLIKPVDIKRYIRERFNSLKDEMMKQF